jgi:hypothetical protein
MVAELRLDHVAYLSDLRRERRIGKLFDHRASIEKSEVAASNF